MMPLPATYRACSLAFLLLIGIGLFGCEKTGERQEQVRTKANDSTETQGESEEKKTPPDYKIRLHWIDIHASYVVTINGFPIRRLRLQGRATNDKFAIPVNTGLIGEGNRAEIRLEPLLTRAEEGLSIATIELEAQVLGPGRSPISGAKITEAQVDSVHAAWSKKVREKWEEYREWEKQWLKKKPGRKDSITWKEGGALDSMRAWASRNPLTVSTTFDNEAGPDFSKIFEEAPRLPDTPATRKRLLDYAMQLREVISNHDGPGLYREIRPAKNAAYREQQKRPPPDSVRRAKWEKAARRKEGWFRDVQEATALGRDQVGLRPWVGGRVWELYRKPGEPLFGGWKIYVGEVDGELKVVRLE